METGFAQGSAWYGRATAECRQIERIKFALTW